MTVRPAEVRQHGPSAAIVLAALRQNGSGSSVPVLVQYAALGRLCGLDQRSVRRALDRLKKAGAVRIEPFRAAGSLLVRTVGAAAAVTEPDTPTQTQPTRRRRDGLARLDTLRSLLEAVG